MNSRKIRMLLIVVVLLFIGGITWAIMATSKKSDVNPVLVEETVPKEIIAVEPTEENITTEEISEKIANEPKAAKKSYQKPTYYIEYYEETITVSASASASASASSNGSTSSSSSSSSTSN